LRATTAFAHAEAGRDVTVQLQRVRATLDECEVGFLTLHDVLGSEFVDLAFCHLDRIAAEVDELADLDVSKWAARELPPIPDEAARTHEVTATLRNIAAAIASLLAQRSQTAPPDRSTILRRRSDGNGRS